MSGVVYTEPKGTKKILNFSGSILTAGTAALDVSSINEPTTIQVYNAHASAALTLNILTPYVLAANVVAGEFLTLRTEFKTASLTNTSGSTITYRVLVSGY